MASTLFILLIILIKLNCYLCGGYKILITLPGISGSQNLVMFRLAESLGERGNDVKILNYNILSEAERTPLKYAEEIIFNITDSHVAPKQIRQNALDVTWAMSDADELPIKRFIPFFQTLSKGCDKLMQEKDLLNRLKSEKFDVVIIHYFEFCSFGLAHYLGIKRKVFMSTAYMLDPFNWYSGSPLPFSYVVSGLHDTTDKINFYHRVKNLGLGVALYVSFQYGIGWTYTDLFRKHFGDEFSSLYTLMSSTNLFYINSDILFEYPKPVMSHVKYIGGFTMKHAEQLTQEWQNIIDESDEHGFVVFSLGSIADTRFMPRDIKNAFYNAFRRIPNKVIWRFEGELPENNTNIYVARWLPQKDLLGHPKIKAFITHGGYNSLTEATYSGVPLIVLPLFGDQFANCKRVERLGFGVTLKKTDLTEAKVYQALQAVLNNTLIQNNARKLGSMIQLKPLSSNDLAVKFIEILARNKVEGKLKTVQCESLNFMSYFMIDVLVLILFTISTLCLLLN